MLGGKAPPPYMEEETPGDPTMNCRVFTLLIGLVLAACALSPPPDSAALPRYANGARVITETFLLELASYTLISPVRCKDSPVDAIRSVAGVEYFASALQWNAAWPNISNMTKLLMVQG